jgi:hypothetical protein
MKKPCLLFVLFLLGQFGTYAQYQPAYGNGSTNQDLPLPKYYIGTGTGLQYKYGIIGLGFGYRVSPQTIVEFNAGAGVYGSKVGLTGIFNSGSKNAWCPFIGFSRSSGIEEFVSDFDIVYNGQTSKVNTSLFLDPVITLTPGLQRQFVTKSGNRFTIDLGYAIALNKQVFGFTESKILVGTSYVNAADVKLTSVQRSAIQILGPSGLTVGVSYNFGF